MITWHPPFYDDIFLKSFLSPIFPPVRLAIHSFKNKLGNFLLQFSINVIKLS